MEQLVFFDRRQAEHHKSFHGYAFAYLLYDQGKKIAIAKWQNERGNNIRSPSKIKRILDNLKFIWCKNLNDCNDDLAANKIP